MEKDEKVSMHLFLLTVGGVVLITLGVFFFFHAYFIEKDRNYAPKKVENQSLVREKYQRNGSERLS